MNPLSHSAPRLWRLRSLWPRICLATVALTLVHCGSEDPETRLKPAASSTSAGRTTAGAASSPGAAASRVTFTEVTQELGLDFVHESGTDGQYLMPEVMAGGGAVFDYDNDGDLDLYLVNAANRANRLYRQERDGRFVDVTEGAGLGDLGYGMGCAVGDVDNDGDLDVYVTNWGADALYKNNGDGTFRQITAEAGIEGQGWSTSAAFLDYDGDGYLDLYVTRYVKFDPKRKCAQTGGRPEYCGPTQFPGVHDLLYRNLGGRGFRDVSQAVGIDSVEDAGLGVVGADFDDDGRTEVYVANDADPNNLWIRQPDGTFFDEAVFRGAAFNRFGTGEAGMGVSVGDADGDGDLDLFMTHLIDETNTYYRNLGEAGFEDATAAVELGIPSLQYTGFGTAFFDYDNDGDLDLGVVNGGVKRRPSPLASRPDWFWNDYAEPNLLLANRGDGTFREASAGAGPGSPWGEIEVSRGFMPADLDGDGDLDLVITNLDGPTRIYRNDGGNEAGWMEIRAVDPHLKREALGARITVVAGGRRYVRYALPPGGYLTSGHGRIHLGLGDAEAVTELQVRWPDGSREVFPGTRARQVVELRKGEGREQE